MRKLFLKKTYRNKTENLIASSYMCFHVLSVTVKVMFSYWYKLYYCRDTGVFWLAIRWKCFPIVVIQGCLLYYCRDTGVFRLAIRWKCSTEKDPLFSIDIMNSFEVGNYFVKLFWSPSIIHQTICQNTDTKRFCCELLLPQIKDFWKKCFSLIGK